MRACVIIVTGNVQTKCSQFVHVSKIHIHAVINRKYARYYLFPLLTPSLVIWTELMFQFIYISHNKTKLYILLSISTPHPQKSRNLFIYLSPVHTKTVMYINDKKKIAWKNKFKILVYCHLPYPELSWINEGITNHYK